MMDSMESKRGQLLVAGPALQDPNFRRTVVLICEHTDDGALGLIINRSTSIEVTEAVPELAGLLGADARLWSGGPVQPQSIVLLAELDDPPEDALMVVGDVGLVLQGADLQELADDARRGRAFLGYAGWGPEQLEGELERGDWIVVGAEPDDAFGEDGDGLWGEVLARQGGEYALLATMPPDPSLN
jgi:putative transcriptional regulator